MTTYQISAPRVAIQTADFDRSSEIKALRAHDPRVGAVCSFVGTVRDRTAGTPGSISSMELEHYPGMTEKAIEAIRRAAQTGQIGDGKIFVSTIEEAIRIRRGESGLDGI